MWSPASTSEAQRFKIHRTTATLLQRYAGLSADQTGFAVRFGRGAAGRDSVQHQSHAASVQAATADKASSRLLLILTGTWVVRFGARALGERRRRRSCVV